MQNTVAATAAAAVRKRYIIKTIWYLLLINYHYTFKTCTFVCYCKL